MSSNIDDTSAVGCSARSSGSTASSAASAIWALDDTRARLSKSMSDNMGDDTSTPFIEGSGSRLKSRSAEDVSAKSRGASLTTSGSSQSTTVTVCAASCSGSTCTVTDSATALATASGRYCVWSRQACALRMNGSAFHSSAARASIASTQRSNASMASFASVSSPAAAGRCSASTALNSCSIAQAASPYSVRPTMRELPLRV
ncbi:hypothetical protein Y695_03211 [Hydrogenophaga sp. T4]|nr:hypothetical protein Y695_03211 [Hydrogenophaga sp. T4]